VHRISQDSQDIHKLIWISKLKKISLCFNTCESSYFVLNRNTKNFPEVEAIISAPALTREIKEKKKEKKSIYKTLSMWVNQILAKLIHKTSATCLRTCIDTCVFDPQNWTRKHACHMEIGLSKKLEEGIIKLHARYWISRIFFFLCWLMVFWDFFFFY